MTVPPCAPPTNNSHRKVSGDAASGGSVTWSQEVLEDLMASITTVDLSSYEGTKKLCFLGKFRGSFIDNHHIQGCIAALFPTIL